MGSAYGFDLFTCSLEDGRERPIAAAPFIFVRSFLYGNELTSMPYIDYGGVCHADWLGSADRDAAQAELIAHARELAKSCVPSAYTSGVCVRCSRRSKSARRK